MKITYFWLTMGPYHIARMNAVASIIGKENLRVIELCSKDDHSWELKNYVRNFDYYCSLPNETLSPKSILKASSEIEKKLSESYSDVIINGCGYFDSTLFKLLKKNKSSYSILLLWSESTLLDNPNPWYKILVKKYYTHIYDGGIVAGLSHSQLLEKIGFKKQTIAVVGNVVENSSFKTKLDYTRKDFLFVGRLLSIKNVYFLIRAFKEFTKQINEWNLTIVGDGPERSNLEQLILDLNLSSKVTIRGLLQPDELIEEYQKHAVFILPSLSEPWGLVVNEAIASDLPVIVSSNCGVAEVFQDGKNGIVFNPNDKNRLVQSMLNLYNSPELRASLAKEAKKVLDELNPEKYAEKSVLHFQNMLQLK